MDREKILAEYKRLRGMIEVNSKVELRTREDASLYYTPGVAEPCREIAEDSALAKEYTGKWNRVAVVTDGSAVLGLGNIGAVAGMPVMEGKCVLFKSFGGVDAVPICLDTQDPQEIIETIVRIAPSFGGINLEDISAPRCFEIESALKEKLDIPVFHDDQHGTAIVCLAALINAVKVVGKNPAEVRVVVNGAGAGGIAITKLIHQYGFNQIVMCDSKGIVSEDRDDLTDVKRDILGITNQESISGSLIDAVKGADIFVGVSKPGVLTKEMIQSMNPDPIVVAMANPIPEIMPDEAREAGAKVVATGRSDFPNQVNNALVFPGIFRGVLDAGSNQITDQMKLKAAEALAGLIQNPSSDKIIPALFDEGVADAVAASVKK